MSEAGKLLSITPQEYLDAELSCDIKHELVDGFVYAMAGASANHERIAGNIYSEFRSHLKNSTCEPFGSDMKLRIADNFYYPDVLVDCQFDESEPYFTTTPVILVEVISKSTRKMDEQIKRLQYMNIATLEEYVVIEQDFVDVKVFRKSDSWRVTHYYLDEEIPFESIGLTLSVSEIYRRVQNEDMLKFVQQLNEQSGS